MAREAQRARGGVFPITSAHRGCLGWALAQEVRPRTPHAGPRSRLGLFVPFLSVFPAILSIRNVVGCWALAALVRQIEATSHLSRADPSLIDGRHVFDWAYLYDFCPERDSAAAARSPDSRERYQTFTL
jgi:hypothetical protein